LPITPSPPPPPPPPPPSQAFKSLVSTRLHDDARERGETIRKTQAPMTDEEELAAEDAKQHCHNEACERASATTHK